MKLTLDSNTFTHCEAIQEDGTISFYYVNVYHEGSRATVAEHLLESQAKVLCSRINATVTTMLRVSPPLCAVCGEPLRFDHRKEALDRWGRPGRYCPTHGIRAVR